MRFPAEHVNAVFAQQVQAFAEELDQRARDRFPDAMTHALAAFGMPRDQMSAREVAFVDALLAGMLQVQGEIVGLALRKAADLLIDALAGARLGFAEASE